MKRKFEKTDKWLRYAYIVLNVITVILGIAILLCGIEAMQVSDGGLSSAVILCVYIILAIAIPFAFWVFIRVALDSYCDIKAIRNKLYDQNNANLSSITGDRSDEPNDNSNANNERGLIEPHDNITIDKL